MGKVRVFSHSSEQWVLADVVCVKPDEDSLRVEYEVGQYICGKALRMKSAALGFNSVFAEGDKLVIKIFVDHNEAIADLDGIRGFEVYAAEVLDAKGVTQDAIELFSQKMIGKRSSSSMAIQMRQFARPWSATIILQQTEVDPECPWVTAGLCALGAYGINAATVGGAYYYMNSRYG